MRMKCLAVLAGAALMGCASAPVAGNTHNNNVITREEISATNVRNAYEAVQRLRPQFFRSHGTTSIVRADPGLPDVYLNHQRYGDIYALQQIEVGSIVEIHYYSPAEALNRFSVGSPSGAIEVITDTR